MGSLSFKNLQREELYSPLFLMVSVSASIYNSTSTVCLPFFSEVSVEE